MNTPLNDALKPCRFTEMSDSEFAQTFGSGLYDLADIEAVHRECVKRLTTRANTPESSAAQGAMTDEAAISAAMSEGNKHGVKSTVSARIVASYLAAQPSDATAQPSATTQRELDGWKENAKHLERSLSDLRNALAMYQQHSNNDYWIYVGDGEDHLESMSNEMAVLISAGKLRGLIAVQPRVDLTDEQIINIAKACAEIDSRGNESFMHYEAPLILNFARALLANTAQGKPEPITEQAKQSLYISALAAKKG